jgi:hypothetical protein
MVGWTGTVRVLIAAVATAAMTMIASQSHFISQ